MVCMTGDLHGDEQAWMEYVDPLLRAGDTAIIPGDFGVGMMHGPMSEDRFYDWIEQKPYTVLVVEGNHENFDRLNAYPISHWHGGRVHRIRRNIIHLMRGEIYEIEGKRVFAFGGGYSLDKALREPGVSWWPEELPSEEEYQNAEIRLREADRRVDYIITHTAPSDSIYYLSRIPRYGVRSDVTEDWELVSFLDRVLGEWNPKKWYFGHYHVDAELWGNQIAMLHAVRELESGDIIGWKSQMHE